MNVKNNVIYKATIKSNNDNKVYIGLTENEIKKTIAVHKKTFEINQDELKYLKYKILTELSKKVYKLEEKIKEYDTLWITNNKSKKPDKEMTLAKYV